MVRKWVTKSVLGLSVLGMAGCNYLNTAGSSGTTTAKPGEAKAAPIDIGAPLYKPEPPEKMAAVGGMEEQIVIPNCVVRLDEKQTVPAQVDGYIQIVGTPIPPGTAFDPNSNEVVYDPQDTKKQRPYRRLREGMRVVEGQEVALFNDLEVLVQIEANQRLIKASDSAITAAKKASAAVNKVLVNLESIGDAASKSEVLNQLATLARYEENVVSAEKEKVRAEGDEKRAWAQHTKHRARCMVKEGIITKVMRSPGEFLKAGEPIMEVLSTERQQVEGNLDAKDAWAVVPGMKVSVEPAVPIGPDMSFGSVNHRQEVTGVAVTSHKTRPLVVSTSLDGTAVVWDVMPGEGKPRSQTRLIHPTPVRAVACGALRTDAKTEPKQFAATGGDDGKLRIWDVTNPDKLADKPVLEGDEAHAASLSCIAYSPDGKFIATAAGREVFIWNSATGKKLYSLPGEHKDAVTTVRFTPQATLVTVARDKTVRVWAIGEKAASLTKAIDHRKGNVDVLGVSSGGGRILFDQEEGKIDVVNLADGRAIASVQQPAAASRFSTLALFSADDSHTLTASADGDAKGELQVWHTPQPGVRASERGRLVTPYRSVPTCAAFSPVAEHKLVVVGTQAGSVHVWPLAAAAERAKARPGTVLSVIRLDPRTVKVQVRTEMPVGEVASLLQDKAAATIIIKPNDPASAPKPALPVPAGNAAGANVPANPIVPAGGFVPAVGAVPMTVVPVVVPQMSPMPVITPPNVTVPSPSITAPGNGK